MKTKHLLYTAIILFPFFSANTARAQNRERHRSVTIQQTVIDGKVVASDTIITYTDTTTRTINSKEVSMDLPYTKGSTVYIDNSYRKLNIRQSKDGKVKLSTTAFFYGEPAFTNEQWLEKLNITMRKADTGIVITSGGINRSTISSLWGDGSYQMYSNGQQIYSSVRPATPEPSTTPPTGTTITTNGAFKKVERNGTTITTNGASKEVRINGSGSINGTANTTNNALKEVDIDGWVNSISNEIRPARSYSTSTGNSTAVFDEKGNNVYTSSSLRREITLYIPADVKLDVISKYADVNADHDLKNLKIKISNGSLDIVNVDKLSILGTYSNISAGNIDEATISATSGKLSVKNINQLQLTTKYMKVAAENCGTLKINSISDDLDLDAIKDLSGTKTYGNLRIDKLTGSFDLKGASSDVRIRNIDPSVSAITLDNKYADIQFPVSNLKNYEVLFSGNYSSVFAPFERRDTTVGKKPEEPNSMPIPFTNAAGKVEIHYPPARKNNNGFSAAVGDTKGTHTKFNLTCSSCNVDFK